MCPSMKYNGSIITWALSCDFHRHLKHWGIEPNVQSTWSYKSAHRLRSEQGLWPHANHLPLAFLHLPTTPTFPNLVFRNFSLTLSEHNSGCSVGWAKSLTPARMPESWDPPHSLWTLMYLWAILALPLSRRELKDEEKWKSITHSSLSDVFFAVPWMRNWFPKPTLGENMATFPSCPCLMRTHEENTRLLDCWWEQLVSYKKAGKVYFASDWILKYEQDSENKG